jgi:hypothetical protein
MFGIGYYLRQKDQLTNNIIDMEGREENGIIISIGSSVFALYGYKVSIACNNELISTRELFKYSTLFVNLNVTPLIEY